MKSTWNESNARHGFRYRLLCWLLVSLASAASTSGSKAQTLHNTKDLQGIHGKRTHGRFMAQAPSLLGMSSDPYHDPQDHTDPGREIQRDAAKEAQKSLDKIKKFGKDTGDTVEDVKNNEPEKIKSRALDNQADKVSEITGVKPNSHGHFNTLFTTLGVNIFIIICAITGFTVLRNKFDLVFSGNVINGIAAGCDQEKDQADDNCIRSCMRRSCGTNSMCSCFSWINSSLNTTTEEAMNAVGLDNAMLLEFFDMNKRILTMIGIPLVCIMCPLHHIYGGDNLPITEISSVAMGNVMMRHPWMYYIHAVIVNLVTFIVIREVYQRMNVFLVLRFKWLKSLPAPRCITVLVEGIPEMYRSDAALEQYFVNLFGPNSVQDAYMVKRAHELRHLWDEEQQLQHELVKAEEQWEKEGKDPEKRPITREKTFGGQDQDSITFYTEKLTEKKDEVEQARWEAKEKAKEKPKMQTMALSGSQTGMLTLADFKENFYSHSGFVTFYHRRNTAHALHTRFTAKRDEWIISSPPPASDVLWNDLKQDEKAGQIYTVMAYACTIGLYFAFTPAVLYGNIFLTQRVHMGALQWAWEVFAPGLSLMLILSFVPTILLLIFRSFFTLKSDVYAQHKLQMWYFGFQMFFVVLVTALGESLWKTALEIVEEPQKTFELMAKYMPHATHFYMNFLMLQWVEQATQLLRMVPLLKFYFFSRVYEREVAKDLCEPEDQDYYGMGARSARFTINMVVGIIFSTLSPLISIFCLVLMGLSRMVYGYLVVFAETKKPDLGGVFFVTTLKHMLLGVFTYNILMIAVLSPSPVGRARTMFPLLLTIPSIIYTFVCYRHFDQNFMWENLPLEEICAEDTQGQYEDNGLRYIQPEFIDEDMQAEIDKACTVKAREKNRSRSGLGGRLAQGATNLKLDSPGRIGKTISGAMFGHSSSEKPDSGLLDKGQLAVGGVEAKKVDSHHLHKTKTSAW
jgi:hypothetical protein